MKKLESMCMQTRSIGRTTGTIFALCITVVLLMACATNSANTEGREEKDKRRERAFAMWKGKCNKAGEFIHERVEGVDGIFLINVRTSSNYDAQYRMDDPYGNDLVGEGYIGSFLRGSYSYANKSPSPEGWPSHTGYRFVELQDPKDGKIYRYTGRVVEPWLTDKNYLKGYLKFVLDKEVIEARSARYGVRFDDISTGEERSNWIAGSSLKVVDLDREKVIAERVGYMIDWAQGSRAGGRSPWLFAAENACPEFDRDFPVASRLKSHKNRNQFYQTERFVEKVLKPAP